MYKRWKAIELEIRLALLELMVWMHKTSLGLRLIRTLSPYKDTCIQKWESQLPAYVVAFFHFGTAIDILARFVSLVLFYAPA